jgi:hypothetical protein
VDGFNVLHAGVLRGRDRAGWRRPEARARLVEALAALAGGPAEIRIVFDARDGGRERDIRRSAETTSDADDDTDIGSPGRDAHRAKRRGSAAGRRPAGLNDNRRSARATSVAAGLEGGPGDDGHSARASSDANGPEAGGMAVVLAPHADDRIVEEVLREAPRRPVTAVTSDRDLARRVRAAGGDVVGAGAFLARLTADAPG